jgi:glycerate dehydrogenase
MPRLVVLDGHTLNPGDLSWEPLARLGELVVYERSPDELVVERSRGADIVITNKTYLGAAFFEQVSGLRGVAVLATGFDTVDAAAARAHGVPVSNVPAYSTASVAQHTLALLFELASHVGLHAASVRRGDWVKSPDFSFWDEPIVELDGLTFGIVGFGAIGQRVARLAQALGMRVLATPSRRLPEPPPAVEYRPLAAIFRESDVVSLHCPLTPETRGLVGAERLASMRTSAFLINTARGALIDEAALARALAQGVIAGAGLDVLTTEPPPADHPLLSAPHCVLTPHQAWTSRAARERMFAVTAANVAGLLAGRPQNVVNG